MIYPQKISSKKLDSFLKVFGYAILFISILLMIINKLTTPDLYWSHLSICGFVYIWLTVKYSITNTRNIANHVMIQTILIAMLTCFVDYRIGYKGWSLNISLPIIIIIANFAMFIITILNYKDYGKYAISQLAIVLLSLSIVFFVYKGYAKINPLITVSIIISIFNFVISLNLCYRDFKEEIIRRFNI